MAVISGLAAKMAADAQERAAAAAEPEELETAQH